MLTQTLAMLLDAYRELNAKRMFWFVLIFSLLSVLAFAAVGINEKGPTFLHWQIDLPALTTAIMSPEDFYKLTFINLGLGVWLTWIATILALVSTASIFPDFIQSGAIELTLSKPIGRLRLFVTKYLTGLLFVVLQVSAFTVASFFVIGIRGGAWEPGLFLAIPIVTAVFSFLFCVCVLVGLVTRSTSSALLLTLLFWGIIFALNSSDAILLTARETQSMSVEAIEARQARTTTAIQDIRTRLAAAGEPTAQEEEQTTAPAPLRDGEGGLLGAMSKAFTQPAEETPERAKLEARLASLERNLESERENLESAKRSRATYDKWHRRIFIAKTILPKTGETTGLMERWLISAANLDRMGVTDAGSEQSAEDEVAPSSERRRGGGGPDPEEVAAGKRVEKILRERSVAWVLGTSLAFEACVLALAGFIFARREF